MFSNCTRLTTAPELPATTLTGWCYSYMFSNCTRLTTAPELPATTLAQYCYQNMFQGCTGLTRAPELTATTLANSCYQGMFRDCSSLTTAPALPATTLANYCYQNMFQGCTGLTKAPELTATTLANSCYNYMFAGCTRLITAPELPATTLANYCYGGMFSGCTSLNYIKCLATNISATNCTTNWVNGVASAGTFVKADNFTGWTTGNNGIPTNWVPVNEINATPLTFEITSPGNIVWKVQNTAHICTIEYKKNDGAWTRITSSTGGINISVVSGDTVQFRGNNATYSSDSSNYNCFSGTTCQFKVKGNIMSLINSTNFATTTILQSANTFLGLFSYCTGLTDAGDLLLPATTLAQYCYGTMFYGCTSLTTAPELPATILVDWCYLGLFYGCTNLNYIKCLATDISATYPTNYWVNGVASTGTFVKNPNMSLVIMVFLPIGQYKMQLNKKK